MALRRQYNKTPTDCGFGGQSADTRDGQMNPCLKNADLGTFEFEKLRYQLAFNNIENFRLDLVQPCRHCLLC